MSSVSDACVIGAGPYGLSIAAHLNAAGLAVRILGVPMGAWRFSVPVGMTLKSAGVFSSLDHPGMGMTLGDYCASRGIPYAENYHPVAASDFADYGMAFQQRFVPQLEEVRVVRVTKDDDLFTVLLETGETLRARKVIVATGTSYYAHIPKELAALPKNLVTHTCMHHGFEQFQGKQVAVLGGGASAVDIASSIFECGIKVDLYARREIEFDDYPFPETNPIKKLLIGPDTSLGPGWQANILERAPGLFRHLPDSLRLKIVKQNLGPAAGCYARDRALGRVPMHMNMRLERAVETEGRLELTFRDVTNTAHTVNVDHLICGTGYVVDVRKLAFLDESLAEQVQMLRGSPRLSANFEANVPGLYFGGLAAAATFGPVLRFIGGVPYAARTIAKHVASELKGDSSRSTSRSHASTVGWAG